MRFSLYFLILLVGSANSAGYYKCSYHNYYDLEDDGSLKRAKGLWDKPGGSFTVDRKSGEYRELGTTHKLEILDPGDKNNSFKAVLSETPSRWGFRLKIVEYSENTKKPFMKTSFSVLSLQTGTCEKF